MKVTVFMLTLAVSTAMAARFMIGAPESMALVMNGQGTVQEFILQGHSVLDKNKVSGFYVTDENSKSEQLVKGKVTYASGKALLKAELPDALEFQSEWTCHGQALNVHGILRDRELKDRALTVRLKLFVKPEDWQFGNSWQGNSWSEACYPDRIYSQIDPIHDQHPSQIPLGAIWSESCGFGGGHSMKHPRFYAYSLSVKDDGTAMFSIAVPLGLARETSRFPAQADFSLTLFPFEPADGFRGAVESYYRLFPECFPVAPRQTGAWALWIPSENAKEASACGTGINQCEFEYLDKQGKAMKATHDAGLLVTQYSEPWGYWVPIPKGWAQQHMTKDPKKIADLDMPLDTKAYRRLLSQDLGDKAAADRFPGLTRDFVAKAIENTAIWRNPRGEWAFNCNFKFNWGARKGDDSTIVIANSNPALPSPNRWDVQKNQIDYARKIAQRAGVKLDVIYLDSLLYMLGWNEYNFRRDQWKHMSVPLTFTRLADGKAVPVEHQALSNVQFLKKHLEYCRKNGYLSMGNSWNPVTQYSIAYLDILGAGEHSDRKGLPPLSDFATLRLLAGRKPVSTMDYALSFDDVSEEFIENRFNYTLTYGIYSGTANAWGKESFLKKLAPVAKKYVPLFKALHDAGWEVNTKAKVTGRGADRVLVERWGSQWNKGLYFTIRNQGKKEMEATLSFDIADYSKQERAVHLPVDAMQKRQVLPRQAVELLSGRKYDIHVSGSRLSVKIALEPERTIVLRIN